MYLSVSKLESLSYKIFNYLVEHYDPSFVVSPISIFNLLGILLNESTDETKREIRNLFQISDDIDNFNLSLFRINEEIKNYKENDTKSRTFSINNKIYCNKEIKMNPKIKDKLFETELYDIDLVKKKMVKNSVDLSRFKHYFEDKLPENVKNFIRSSLCWQERWRKAFSLNDEKEDFIVGDKKIQFNMLTQTNHVNYYEAEEFKAMQIPYSDSAYSFIGVLPEEGVSVETVLKLINEKGILDLVHQMTSTKIEISIPPFQMNKEIDMKDLFGMTRFQDFFRDINFSKILNGLKDHHLIHSPSYKCVKEGMKPNKEETGRGSVLHIYFPTNYEIKFTRPFLYFIVKSGFVEMADENYETLSCFPVLMGRFSG
ncbi:serpin-type proteinase inhibitor 24 [Vairimorpha necatrix]|uniref:Serpin-type proteinase inhibitor 24 n=1 Tax=Vairimorpha necatrix TaxID=6039 RepID=A0AAX4JEJ0_9MICR